MFIRQTYAKVAKSNISIKMNARTNLTKNFSGKFTQTVKTENLVYLVCFHHILF